ncbi:hypothetical protein GEMRC1_006347 [Eukaryota sp. GEM-RC1]
MTSLILSHIQYSVNYLPDNILSALNGLITDGTRLFFLQCVLRSPKFMPNDKHVSNDLHMLFEQEMGKVFAADNSSSRIVTIVEPLPPSSLDKLLLYPFSPLHRLMFAMALLQSPTDVISRKGLSSLLSLLPELTSATLTSLPTSHRMELRSLLLFSSSVELKQHLSLLDNLLHQCSDSEDALLAFADSLFSSTPEPLTSITNVSASAASSISLAGVVLEHGPPCTMNSQAFARLLSDFGDVSESDVGDLLAAVISSASADSSNPWNLSIVGEVLSSYQKPTAPHQSPTGLNWAAVLSSMDSPLLQTPITPASLSSFLSDFIFQVCRSTDVFIKSLVGDRRTWTNVDAQVEMLDAVLSLPQSEQPRFSTASSIVIPSPDKLPPPPGRANQHHSATVPPPEVEPWLSLDLIKTVLELGDTHVRPKAGALLLKPGKLAPEVILLGLSMLTDKKFLSPLYSEIQHALFPAVLRTIPAASPVLYKFWESNKNFLANAMVHTFSKDPSMISRLIDIVHELRALLPLLQCTDLYFTIGLASLAARREYLHLERWLKEGMSALGPVFANAAVVFLTSFTSVDSVFSSESTDIAMSPGKINSTPTTVNKKAVPITSEIRSIFCKVFTEHHSLLTQDSHDRLFEYCRSLVPVDAADPGIPTDDLRQILQQQVANSGTVKGPSKLDLSLPPEPSPVFPPHIDQIANGHFVTIFDGSLCLNDVVVLFKRLKRSPPSSDDYSVYRSLIHHLMDEIRFIDLYPPEALRIFARVFGVIFACDVETYEDAGIALRQLLQLLLDTQKSSTAKYPHRQIEIFIGHFVAQFVHRLVEWTQYLDFVLDLTAVSRYTTFKTRICMFLKHINSHGIDYALSQLDGEEVVLPGKAGLLFEPTLVADDGYSPEDERRSVSKSVDPVPNVGSSIFQSSCAALLRSSRRRIITVPETEVTDKISFVLNNITLDTAKMRGNKEVRPLLLFREDILLYFVEHLVLRRIVTEPRNHELYYRLLEGIVETRVSTSAKTPVSIWAIVLDSTTHHVRGLLADSELLSSFEARSSLKALGAWLGLITLGRDRPLLRKDIYLRGVLIDGYVKGRLLAVVPFVTHILRGCLRGKLFRPPCPWTMYILRLLSEVHQLPDARLNMKFEIESVMRKLSVKIDDVTPAYPDRILNRYEVEPAPEVNLPPTPALPRKSPPPPPTPFSSNTPSYTDNDIKTPTPAVSSPIPLELPQPKKIVDVDSVVKTGHDAVTTLLANSKHSLDEKELELIFSAVATALRETTTPVIERAIRIAGDTARVLVNKDMAVVKDSKKYQSILTNTVSVLALHLSSVTCKEPLRYSIQTSLVAVLKETSGSVREKIQSAIQVYFADIVHVCSEVIETASADFASQIISQYCHSEIQSRSNGTFAPPLHSSSVQQVLALPKGLKWTEGYNGYTLTEEQDQVYKNLSNIPKLGVKSDTSAAKSNDNHSNEAIMTLDQSLDDLCTMSANDIDQESLSSLPPTHTIHKELSKIFSISNKHSQSTTFVHTAIHSVLRRYYETKEDHGYLRIDVLAKVLSILKEICNPTVFRLYTQQLSTADLYCYSKVHIPALLIWKVIDHLDYFPYLAAKLIDSEKALNFAIFIVDKFLVKDRSEPLSAFQPLLSAFKSLSPKPVEVSALLQSIDTLYGLIDQSPIDKNLVWKSAIEVVFSNWNVLLARAPVNVTNHDSISGASFDSKLGGSINLFVDSLFLRGYLTPAKPVKSQPVQPDAQFIKSLIDIAIEQSLPTCVDSVYNPSPLDSCALLLSSCVVRVGQGQANSVPSTAKLAQRVIAGLTERMLSSFVGGRVVDQRPWLRLFSSLLHNLTSPDPVLDSIYWNVITLFFQSLRTIKPSVVPAFALSWVQLLSHKAFLPALLDHKEQNGWLMLEKLLILLLQFMEPF